MSVFTKITQAELQHFLQQFDVGELNKFTGIDAGIDNTNYFVDTHKNKQDCHFVLTLFETINFENVQYPLSLMGHLADHGIPSARPVADKQNQYLHTLKEKPATLVQRLSGKDIEQPNLDHCRQAAKILAQFHIAGRTFSMQRNNPMGLRRWLEMEQSLKAVLNQDDLALIRSELELIQDTNTEHLPRGAIHADLFRDNILFNQNQIAGVIDIYFSCTDLLLYDLAIAVNDWCIQSDVSINQEKAAAMLAAYHKERPFTAEEQTVWPLMLRTAALRFWLSRLYDLHFPRPGELTHCKDPDHMKTLLRYHRQNTDQSAALWPAL